MARLQTKILLSLSSIAAGYLLVSSWILRSVLLPSFASLERDGARADLARTCEALTKEIEHVDNFVNDWSGWDDTYQYMADANEAYFKSNLENDVFRRDSFDCLVFVRLDGSEVWRGAAVESGPIEIPELPHAWPASHPLLAPRRPADSARGVLLTARGPLLMASRIVTDSTREAPARGWILMGRFLDRERVAALAAQVHLDVAILAAPAVQEPMDRMALAKCGRPGFDGVEARRDDLMVGVAAIPALDGSPGLFVRVDVARTILSQGKAALAYAGVAMLVAVLVLFGGMLFTLRRLVVRPIVDLTSHALEIRRSDDLTLRCGSDRRDELGTLAREFDHMVGELAASRSASIERARAGGKSEIATEVLHDVGNTMQGLRTASSLLSNGLQGRVFTDAQRLEDLLLAHREDLGDWIAQDATGRKVPTFVLALLAALLRERDTMANHVAAIAEALAHVEGLLDRQRQHAGKAGIEERVRVGDLFDDALRLARIRPDLATVCEGATDAAVIVERHRLVAALVNLLRNAEEAIPLGRKGRIELAATVAADGGLCITVTDDGVGIAAEDLTRVFALGFSTKPRGSGVGLHSCATTLAELGGSTRAESDGVGRGARVILRLPARCVANAAVLA